MKQLIFILLLIPLSILAQEIDASDARDARQLVREGNELYKSKKYADAEIAFLKALKKNPTYETAQYNLGNALLKQNRVKDALEAYEKVGKTTKDKGLQSELFHNLGNILYGQKDYPKALEMYKNALRLNPADEETRYNLALTKERIEEQQNQDKNQDNKDQDNQDQENKDNQNQDQQNQDQKDGDDQQDQNKEEGDDQKEEQDQQGGEDKKDKGNPENQEGQQQQPQKGSLSPQQVQQLLEAMNNEEKKTQEKVNAQKVQGQRIHQEKDW